MRRYLSINCLLFAWLCAHGALWNVVQVVAWAKMFHDYSATMPTAEALELTFDASKPCKLCCLAKSAEDTARKQLPHDAALGGGTEKLLLIFSSFFQLQESSIRLKCKECASAYAELHCT